MVLTTRAVVLEGPDRLLTTGTKVVEGTGRLLTTETAVIDGPGRLVTRRLVQGGVLQQDQQYWMGQGGC